MLAIEQSMRRDHVNKQCCLPNVLLYYVGWGSSAIAPSDEEDNQQKAEAVKRIGT